MSMKLNYFFLSVIFILTFSITIKSQNEDSLKNYWLSPVEIQAKRVNLGELSNKISKDNLENILGKNGFSLIRKGVFFAQDIYADGLKKGDINVVIDGERYHSACPNRMDSPLTRINPLELESVDLSKNSSNIQSGLGGFIQFNRQAPSAVTGVKAELSVLAGAQEGVDFAVLGDYSNHRISLRYSNGSPYVDGENNTFKDSYNYKENFDFTLAEGSIRGKYNLLSYGASFSYTEDVSFPYLLMDERYNRVYSAHLRYDKHKVYCNYTDHMMDNDLRNNTMIMRTSVSNLTIGAIGNYYEVVYRNWDADNFFRNAQMNLTNDLMPNVSTYLVNLFHSMDFNNIKLHGKLGLSYKSAGEESRKVLYEEVYDDVNLDRYFPLFSVGASYLTALTNKIGAGMMLELNSESPETESLFIGVKKPGTKPAWVGNPTLDQPIKASLRGLLSYSDLSVELFASQVWNYSNLVKSTANEKNYLTFANVDAQMLGTNIYYNHENIELGVSYVWAKNTTNDSPLSEIQPLSISTKLISPEYYNLVGYIRHTYNDAQLRIDELLNEGKTPAWNKIDLGINYSWSNLSVSLDVENILDHNYYQHLSFLRDPFSAKSNVFDPGRTFRVTFKTNQLF